MKYIKFPSFILSFLLLNFANAAPILSTVANIGGGNSCTVGSDILFVIDDSGSMSFAEYSQAQTSIVDVGNQLLSSNSEHQIATIHFGGPKTDYVTGGQHVFFERDFSRSAVIAPVRQFANGGSYNSTWTEDYLAGALLHMGWGLDGDNLTIDPYIISPLKELARRNSKPLHILIFTDTGRNGGSCCTSFIDRSDSGYQPDDGSEFTIFNLYKDQGVTLSVVGFNLQDDAKAAAATVSSFGGSYNDPVDANPSDPETGSGGKRLILANPGTFSLTPAQVALVTTHANCSIPSSDFGDAPSSYGDATHAISAAPSLYLGIVPPDEDSGSQASANADNDNNNEIINDEDGVTAPGSGLSSGNTEALSVVVQGNGILNAWVDLNQDGDFGDTGEQIANEQSVSSGTVSLSVAIPSSVSGSEIFSRFRLCSDTTMCNTPTGSSDDGEVEDYALVLALSCTALSGDVSQISAAVPIQIASGDKVFVASSSPAPNKQGHFKAYTIQNNGDVSTTIAWDADDEMITAERQARLFSTNSSGSKTLFNLLNDAAFNISGSDPVVAKIKEYSFNPSVDGGSFLAGRASGSFLGALGKGNDVAMLENRVNTWLYLDDSDYRTFASTISSRSPKAIVTSDDGFVYAFNQSDGDLVWGWIPRQLVSELKNYDTFQGARMMSGILDTLEFKLSSSYGSYVIGSYKEGLGQYTLKLDATDNDKLESVVWDLDYSLVANGAFQTAPNQGEREYFKVNDETYTAYIVSKSSLSTLVIKKLGDTTAATTIALNFHVTASPFVMPDYGNSLAPASRTLYLGAENGDIKRATLFNGSTLETAASIKTALEGAAVGALSDSSEAITFLGASSAESGSSYYMRAQSEERLTLLKYNTSTTLWDHIWTSYVTGAGTWDSSNSYTADSSGEPSDDDSDGFFTNVTATGIQSIPAGARITDTAKIIAGTVILPVSVPSTVNCFGNAYYYLYQLNTGEFPIGKFLALDNSVISGDIALGYGDPKRVEIAEMSSNNKTLGFGNTDQKPDNTTGVTASFIINNNKITGIRGWKERTQ